MFHILALSHAERIGARHVALNVTWRSRIWCHRAVVLRLETAKRSDCEAIAKRRITHITIPKLNRPSRLNEAHLCMFKLDEVGKQEVENAIFMIECRGVSVITLISMSNRIYRNQVGLVSWRILAPILSVLLSPRASLRWLPRSTIVPGSQLQNFNVNSRKPNTRKEIV